MSGEDTIFKDTATELWEACGNWGDWISGRCDTLSQKLLRISLQHEYADQYDESLFHLVMDNYHRRKTFVEMKLILGGHNHEIVT